MIWRGLAAFGLIAIGVRVVMGLLAAPGEISHAWNTRPSACAQSLQDLLVATSPEHDPAVEKCTGEHPRAMLCFASGLDENGQRRTLPVRWDCVTHRVLPPQ